jgi:alpha-L-rhamnosidase
LLNLGAKTWWERFDANLYQWASLSHGWGGAPSWFLTTYILGVRQSGPDAWVVQPALAGVNNASGTLPLKNGVLKVQWEGQACQNSHIGVLAAGSTGEVVVPFTDPTTILTLNGKTVWENGMPLAENVTVDPKGIHIILNGGNYDISIHQDCGKTSLTNP